ncbi:hypothetical protein Glove_460g60 [Diversispora epigaea]|uniref:Uncharacterized protein n=1 Tax=Diversispora epigaea TaxID=1348612 RepID=A0A397GNH1_9GLOM|nr:hypothetical protein Glove_460g60 [Diversispora epigaea]
MKKREKEDRRSICTNFMVIENSILKQRLRRCLECLGGDLNHVQSNYFWNGELIYVINGENKFPTRPSYVQFGIWDGSSPDITQWSHGPVKWYSLPDKLITQVTQIQITCDPNHNVIV